MSIGQLKTYADKRKNPGRALIQNRRPAERSALKEFLKQRKKSCTQ